jgi:RimJ/RimL family protein N-acetyltransferase
VATPLLAVIREAGPADLETVLEIQEQASLASIGSLYPPERPYPATAVRERWRQAFITRRGRFTLAEVDGIAVGVAMTTASQLYAIHVVPDAWGTGVANQLHDEAITAMFDAGHDTLRAWVMEENHRSRRFFERSGWRLDGSTRLLRDPPHLPLVGYAITIEAR